MKSLIIRNHVFCFVILLSLWLLPSKQFSGSMVNGQLSHYNCISQTQRLMSTHQLVMSTYFSHILTYSDHVFTADLQSTEKWLCSCFFWSVSSDQTLTFCSNEAKQMTQEQSKQAKKKKCFKVIKIRTSSVAFLNLQSKIAHYSYTTGFKINIFYNSVY